MDPQRRGRAARGGGAAGAWRRTRPRAERWPRQRPGHLPPGAGGWPCRTGGSGGGGGGVRNGVWKAWSWKSRGADKGREKTAEFRRLRVNRQLRGGEIARERQDISHFGGREGGAPRPPAPSLVLPHNSSPAVSHTPSARAAPPPQLPLVLRMWPCVTFLQWSCLRTSWPLLRSMKQSCGTRHGGSRL